MKAHPQDEQLSAFIDEMLDVAQMRQITQHLLTCESCRATCTALRETRDLMHNLSVPPMPSPTFWADSYRRLRVETQEQRQVPGFRTQLREYLRGPSRRWAAGVTAFAVFGAVVAAPLISHNRSQEIGITAPNPASVDVVDFSSLVRDHTQSAAQQPLADSDRQTMLLADVDDRSVSGDPGAEAASDGSVTSDVSP